LDAAQKIIASALFGGIVVRNPQPQNIFLQLGIYAIREKTMTLPMAFKLFVIKETVQSNLPTPVFAELLDASGVPFLRIVVEPAEAAGVWLGDPDSLGEEENPHNVYFIPNGKAPYRKKFEFPEQAASAT
jgi:hypothetical protein